jgi:hypothetical protein
VLGDELVQLGHPDHPVRDALNGQHLTVGGHHAHIMVALGPVDPDQQHKRLPSRLDVRSWPGGGLRRPN